ncbi:MAG: hypothetical protein KAS23_04310 [Anaerohalosphaera sp.]|nr:hypothetical protein [Anaerohalosphaera sp.]
MGTERIIQGSVIIICIFFIAGCGPKISSTQQVKEFSTLNETPVVPEEKKEINYYSGPYRVVPGDVLEFQMPAVLRITSSNLNEWFKPGLGYKDIDSYYVRVDDEGNAILPIIGSAKMVRKTLAEIEADVANSYYPEYVVKPPMIVCRVSKYNNENERIFSITGLVNNPDTFPYPPDVQYNLMETLAFAGGLDTIADPHYLRILRENSNGDIQSLIVSVKSKDFDKAAKLPIEPGDIICVDQTARTRTNQFLSGIFKFGVGAEAKVSGM